MAFCTKCGRKLEPGEVCHCQDFVSSPPMDMSEGAQDLQQNTYQAQQEEPQAQQYYQQESGNQQNQQNPGNQQYYQQGPGNQQYYQQNAGNQQNQQYYQQNAGNQQNQQNQQYYQQNAGNQQNQQYYQQNAGNQQNQQYYQQNAGNQQNQQYYQQNAGNQQYYQQGPGNQQYYQQNPGSQQYNREQGPSREAEWLNQKKDAFVAGASNMFSEILPILKSPAKHVQEIADRNNMSVGLEFILGRMFLMILWVLILLFKVKSSLGGYSQYVKLPWVQAIILMIVITLGVDCLWALFLKLFTGAFGGHATFNGMLTVVGCSSLFESIGIAAAIIFALFSPTVSCVIIGCGSSVRFFMEMGAFFTYAPMSSDRKSYAYLVAKMLCTMVAGLVIVILAGSMLESLVSRIF